MIARHVARVAAHQHDVARLDRHVRPGADGDAHVGRHQRRRVVHAVAHHRHPLALALQLLDLRRLLLRQHLAKTVSMPSSSRHGVGDRLGVAGQHHDLDALLVQPLHRLARLRADRVGDREGGERPVRLRPGRSPPGPAPPRARRHRRSAAGGLDAELCEQVRPADLQMPRRSTIARTPWPGIASKPLAPRARRAPRSSALLTIALRDRVLRVALDRRRQPERLVAGSPVGRRRSRPRGARRA